MIHVPGKVHEGKGDEGKGDEGKGEGRRGEQATCNHVTGKWEQATCVSVLR